METLRKLGAEGSSEREAPSQLPTLLYVEDEEENWEVTQVRLRDRYRLVWAKTDREACELIRALGGKLHAILMDIQLKGSTLDGIQLAQLFSGKLSQEFVLPEFARSLPPVETPILFVTAYGARYTPEQLLHSGGCVTVTKPVDFLRLSLALASIRAKNLLEMLET